MAEVLAESQALESTTVGIYRTATVVKGGRRFSFGALVVVGDRAGSVGIGYGKAPGVPSAIEKAQKDAKRNLVQVILQEGTLPHMVTGLFKASRVRLIPAAPGTGVIAGATVRAMLEMVGVRDCLTKAYGSTNAKNLCKAVMEGLSRLRTRDQIAQLRGVTIESTAVDDILASSRRFMTEQQEGGKKAAAPVNVVGQKGGRGGNRGRGRGGGGRGRGPGASAPAEAAPVVASQPPPASSQSAAPAQDQSPPASSGEQSTGESTQS